ncbi:MAG: Phosphomannomutase [Microgenomates group bacterium GW2011_GWA2_37_6]|nr:MAG: Phosphomannomutase [Microgenomates group bacterium GW2011_GWA2_37_6]
MPTLKRTMFREYDLRGREADDELSDSSMYYIGKGFGTYLRKRNIDTAVVGHDARGTSESFHKSVIKGLTECGINVIDIGTVTTPMGYWAQYFLKVKGLVTVTASHNPVGWNGVKLGSDLSYTLLTDELAEVYDIIEKEEFIDGSGTITKQEILEEYMKDLISRAKITKKFRVLVNTANGTAGIVMPELLRRAGCDVVEHFTNIDPTYPNYTANPDGTAMMEDTGAQTVANKCDLGMAFDGDCDRLGLTDEKGNTIWPDRYIILLSRLVLSKKPGAKIIFDVKVSEALPQDIKAHGGIPIMWKTGHSYIKSKLAEENAAMAGEMSGHIFFVEDFYGFDDGAFAALKMLEYLSAQDKPLSEIIAGTPYYVSTPTIQVKTTDEDKYKVVGELTEEFKKEGNRVVDISGARVYFSDGWGLVRASSNTPTLVLRFEAKTQEGLDRIQKLFKEKLDKFDIVSKDWDSTGH